MGTYDYSDTVLVCNHPVEETGIYILIPINEEMPIDDIIAGDAVMSIVDPSTISTHSRNEFLEDRSNRANWTRTDGVIVCE